MSDNLVKILIPNLMEQYQTSWSIDEDALFLLQCICSDNPAKAKYFLTQINPSAKQQITEGEILRQLPTGAVTPDINESFTNWWKDVKNDTYKQTTYENVKLEDKVFLV